MKYAVSGLLIAMISIFNSMQAAEATNPLGFLVPIGGGASIGDNNVLKPAQIDIHRRALQKLQQNIDAEFELGSDVCLLEYRTTGPERVAGVDLNKDLFIAAGAADARIKSFIFDSREKADSPAIESLKLKDCGIFFIPGGDQTVIFQLWAGTRLHKQMLDLLRAGGGIMGKSAGAALQGTLLYLPRSDSATSAGAFLKKIQLYPEELSTNFLAHTLKGLPRLYIETHTGDRERSARVLAVLAAWENGKTKNESRAMAMAMDSDTAALIEYSSDLWAWTAEVIGARAIEFMIPDIKSRSKLTARNQAVYTDMPSSLLLAGSKIQISGSRVGRILTRSLVPRSKLNLPVFADKPCLKIGFDTLQGSSEENGEAASQVFYRIIDPKSGALLSMNEVEYAYLSGDLLTKRKAGCGFWLTHAFDLDFGHPENRLNVQRFALGSAHTEFSISLPTSMQAISVQQIRKNKLTRIRFEAINPNESSSLLVFDARKAISRGTAKYIYEEYGAKNPVQTGTWENMRLHLIAPNSQFDLETGSTY